MVRYPEITYNLEADFCIFLVKVQLAKSKILKNLDKIVLIWRFNYRNVVYIPSFMVGVRQLIFDGRRLEVANRGILATIQDGSSI